MLHEIVDVEECLTPLPENFLRHVGKSDELTIYGGSPGDTLLLAAHIQETMFPDSTTILEEPVSSELTTDKAIRPENKTLVVTDVFSDWPSAFIYDYRFRLGVSPSGEEILTSNSDMLVHVNADRSIMTVKTLDMEFDLEVTARKPQPEEEQVMVPRKLLLDYVYAVEANQSDCGIAEFDDLVREATPILKDIALKK